MCLLPECALGTVSNPSSQWQVPSLQKWPSWWLSLVAGLLPTLPWFLEPPRLSFRSPVGMCVARLPSTVGVHRCMCSSAPAHCTAPCVQPVALRCVCSSAPGHCTAPFVRPVAHRCVCSSAPGHCTAPCVRPVAHRCVCSSAPGHCSAPGQGQNGFSDSSPCSRPVTHAAVVPVTTWAVFSRSPSGVHVAWLPTVTAASEVPSCSPSSVGPGEPSQRSWLTL